MREGALGNHSQKTDEFDINRSVQWGGGITGHLLFTPVMSHESEV